MRFSVGLQTPGQVSQKLGFLRRFVFLQNLRANFRLRGAKSINTKYLRSKSQPLAAIGQVAIPPVSNHQIPSVWLAARSFHLSFMPWLLLNEQGGILENF